MAATSPLLAGLLKRATIDDHDEYLKASRAALKKNNFDSLAQHVQVVALLYLDQYAEALRFIEEGGQSLKDKAALEYAYALYKTGNLQQAADVAAKVGGRGALHLEAQAQYRLENSARALQIYDEIRQQGLGEEEFDIRVNSTGVEAQTQWLGQTSARRPGAQDMQLFETAYNAACGSIARGEYAQAEILLKRAHELCKHHEDLDEDQKAEELLPIRVQQMYVLLMQGKNNDAHALADDISVDTITDPASKAIARSNSLLTSSKPSNPFLLHRVFHDHPRISQSDKLFSYQAVPFASNEKTADLGAMKFNGMKKSSKKEAASISPEAVLASTFSAAARAQNQVSKAAITQVLPELERRPTDIGLVLTLVQMYLLVNNHTSAIEVVEALFKRLESSADDEEKSLRYNPGLVSIMIGLYRSRGRKHGIKTELAGAAAYWRNKPTAPPSLLRAAGVSLLESGDVQETKAAAEMFSKLREQQPGDRAALAGYVASHAEAETIGKDADKLSSIDALTRNIDVDALEKSGIPQTSNALAIAQLTRTRKRGADGASSKPKRIRQSKLSKDYDPSKTPDPERWLPMKDRSYYRPPKAKKKGKKSGGETQGGAVNEALNMEVRSGTATPINAGGGGGGGGGGGKKKKGKR